MKKELLKYTCDQCGNTITVLKDNYKGTPLHTKWVRLYVMVKLDDKEKTKMHFCGRGCCVEFLSI